MGRGLTITSVTGVVQLSISLVIMFTAATSNVISVSGDCDDMEEENDTLCLTPECIGTASRILKNMNPEIHPCDDFYKFACGGYENTTTIADDEVSVDVFTVIADQIQTDLRKSLEEPSSSDDLKAFGLAKTLYKSCMNNTAIEAVGLKQILETLKQAGNWPVLEGDNWKEDDFSWTATIYKLRRLGYQATYLIHTSFDPTSKNSSKRVIGLDQPSLGIAHPYLSAGLDNEITKAYYDYMVDIAVILGADKQRAAQELGESLAFEMKLANITLPDVERRNITLLENPMTVAELNERYSGVNWTAYLNELLFSKIRVDTNEIVVVHAPSYISGLLQLLNTTSKQVQANYLMWRTVLTSINYLTEEIKNRQLDFNRVSFGQTKRRPRWEECYRIVTGFLPISTDALYVRKYFDRNAKIVATELIEDIRNEFTYILQHNEWMDNETKSTALKKIATMQSNVAYPDELFDDSKVEEYYTSLELRPDNLLGNIQSITRFFMKHVIENFREPVNKSDWTEREAAVVNAHYDDQSNSIEITAGVLQGSLFNKDRLQCLNYGSEAVIIGHEMTHGFDDIGSQFDADGNLVDWWKPETKEKFLKQSQCFIDQYSNYTDKTVGLALNGKRTQGENIADNGGVKIGYRAYLDWSKRNGLEQKLPGLEYTPQQLYWIAAAQTFCAKYRPEYLEYIVLADVHSPAQYRVRGSLSNRPEFAADFNCPVGSAMNPEKKCAIW